MTDRAATSNEGAKSYKADRAAVLREAREWLGTPYAHMGRVKGLDGGVDCAQLIWLVYYNVGLTPFMPVEKYPPDFMLHRDIERYMKIVLDRAREITEEEAQPADVVLYKMGRVFAHGGLILERGWPHILHANSFARMVVEGRGDQGRLRDRPRRFFTRF